MSLLILNPEQKTSWTLHKNILNPEPNKQIKHEETPATTLRAGMGGIFPPSGGGGTPHACGLQDTLPMGAELMTPVRGMEHEDILRLSM